MEYLNKFEIHLLDGLQKVITQEVKRSKESVF